MFARYLKSHDVFGHPVVLNFQGDKDDDPSDSYTTVIGGIFSLLTKCLYYVCCGYFAFRMFTNADNRSGTIIAPVNWK